MNVLVLNAGSSSLKFQVIATDPDRMANDTDERLARGVVERIGGEAIVTIQKCGSPRQKSTAQIHDIAGALRYVVGFLTSDETGAPVLKSIADVHAIGHRVVHGGELFHQQLQGVELLMQRYRQAGLTGLSHDFYSGGRHEMLNEINRAEVRERLLAWITTVTDRSGTQQKRSAQHSSVAEDVGVPL
jgi:hypothetical protein